MSADLIAEVLASATEPLDVPAIVAITGLETRDVDACLWDAPDRFLWQPGHKWTLRPSRSRPTNSDGTPEDSRHRPLLPLMPTELRAITLASGITLRVARRPMDSDAFFTVRSSGSNLELVLNSTHELFETLPIPFDDRDTGQMSLVEMLLSAWALYEDSVPGGSMRRAMEDVRLLWGRRTIELLRNSDQ